MRPVSGLHTEAIPEYVLTYRDMVPLRLTLKNFLCYRGDVPTLDFGGIHLACLSGQNGHGKSALLDAITWALWGKARSSRDDDLIYYGTDEMRVELDFRARESSYRVVRRRRRNRASDLQLQIANGDVYTPITGNSIRETNARIQQLIGMDYDTFINSAFLVQGRANEFTNKTASDRKEVLGKLIGLAEYDALQAMARERAREKDGEVQAVEGRLQRMQQEVARKDGLHEESRAVGESLRLLDAQLEAKQAECVALKLRVDALRTEQQALAEMKQRSARLGQELAQLQKQAEAHQERIERYQESFAAQAEIHEGMRQLATLRDRFEEMDQARAVYSQLRDLCQELSASIGKERSRLETQADGLQARIQSELSPAVQAAPGLAQKLEEARLQHGRIQAELDVLDAKGATLPSLASDMGRLEAEMQALESEGRELRTKQKMFEASGSSSSCPLCGTTLDEEQCRYVSEGYDAQIGQKLNLHSRLKGDLQVVKDRKVAVEKEFLGQDKLRQQLTQAQRMVVQREGAVAEAARAAEQLTVAEGQLADLRRRLEDQDYARQELAQLKETSAQVDALGYSDEAHRELRRQIQELRPVEERGHRLREAEEALPQEKQALEQVQSMADERVREREELRQKGEAIAAAIPELAPLEEELTRQSAAAEGLQRSQRSALQQQGEVEGELRRLEELEGRLQGEQEGLRTAQEALGLYRELEGALGKRGVQAMLIDALLPRVEDTANELLSRMTDGRMHVKLETQRERRGGQGEPIETLEIAISDELGARPYELFSGGEAFRINLALRIALSKELARRRGAPLPTLFIDEGFGTQDATGRDRILDVINAIAPDFEKIFVITHLDDLKDAFPVQVQVEKDERGSSVWIS